MMIQSSSTQTPDKTLAQGTLGTLLRHLTDLLESAVEQSYVDSGLDYRPRFTPIVRALMNLGPSSLRAISVHAGITHSAVSQTVAEMVKREWLTSAPGKDARELVVSLSDKANAAVPILKRRWAATNAASDSLDQELSSPLFAVLREAIQHLEERPFADRIAEAVQKLEVEG